MKIDHSREQMKKHSFSKITSRLKSVSGDLLASGCFYPTLSCGAENFSLTNLGLSAKPVSLLPEGADLLRDGGQNSRSLSAKVANVVGDKKGKTLPLLPNAIVQVGVSGRRIP